MIRQAAIWRFDAFVALLSSPSSSSSPPAVPGNGGNSSVAPSASSSTKANLSRSPTPNRQARKYPRLRFEIAVFQWMVLDFVVAFSSLELPQPAAGDLLGRL
jgi:hypothetical protein